MEDLIDRLRDLLSNEFPGAEIELEQARPAEKVGGSLIWSGFEGMEQIDRQQKLAKVIRAALPREDQVLITLILTLIREERSVPSEQ